MASTIRRGRTDNEGQLAERLDEIIHDELPSGNPGEVFVSAPSMDVLEEIGRLTFDDDIDHREITVLFNADLLRPIQRDFLLASRLEERKLTEEEDDDGQRGHIKYVKTAQENISNLPVISAAEELLAFVAVVDQEHELSTDSETALGDVYAEYQELAEDVTDEDDDGPDFRTPSRSQMYETLTEYFTEDVARDHARVIEELERIEDLDREAVGVELVTLLVGAKHELLQFNMGHWAESVGAASKATFSRRKGDLEDLGYLGTSKSPVDIGRPRNRLHLTDKAGESPEELAEIAASMS